VPKIILYCVVVFINLWHKQNSDSVSNNTNPSKADFAVRRQMPQLIVYKAQIIAYRKLLNTTVPDKLMIYLFKFLQPVEA